MPADVEALFDALISATDETPLAELLTVWNKKGTTEDELCAFASIMRKRMKLVNSKHETFVDVVGTGWTNGCTVR